MARSKLKDCDINKFREELCDVALKLFSERGREGVSLRAVTRAMGCSHTTPYRYFESVEAIFAAVRIRCFERFETFLRQRLDPIEDPLQAIRQLSLSYFDFAVRNRSEFEVMFAMDQPDPTLYPESIEAGKKAWRVPLELSRRAVESGALEADPEELAHLLWSGVHGIAVLHLAGKFSMGKDASELLIPHVEALIRAFSKRREP